MFDTIMYYVLCLMVFGVFAIMVNGFINHLIRAREEAQYREWVRRQALDYPHDLAPRRAYKPNMYGMPIPVGLSVGGWRKGILKYTPPVW